MCDASIGFASGGSVPTGFDPARGNTQTIGQVGGGSILGGGGSVWRGFSNVSGKIPVKIGQAGGGFAIFKGNSVRSPVVLRCGSLDYLGSNRVSYSGPNSHLGLNRVGLNSHPLTGNRVMVYELRALILGLLYNQQILKLPALTVLTDSSDLERVLKGHHTVPETLGETVEESERYYEEFMVAFSLLRQIRTRVAHVYREANLLADTLSFLGQKKKYDWDNLSVKDDAEVRKCLEVYRTFDDVWRHQQ